MSYANYYMKYSTLARWPCGAAAGILFQYPGLVIAALVGAGAANVLKHPAPWLHGLTSGAWCQIMRNPQNPY